MPENTRIPPIAPSFMRPQRPALDEPLDIERDQKTVPAPFAQSPAPQSRAPQPQPTAEAWASSAVDFAIGEAALEVEERSTASSQATVGPAGEAPPVATTAPEVDSDPPVAPQVKQRLTPLQRLIVALLIIVVLLLVAIIYLTLTGQIALRPEVMPTLEGWLSGIL